MATIGAMAGQMGTMYQMIQKSGGSLFGNTSATKLPSYFGQQNSNVNNSAYSVFASRSELDGLLKEYDSTKKQFNTEFGTAMSDLKTATRDLKATNFAVAPKGADDKAIEANTKTATAAVTAFVDKYNAANTFLQNNTAVSNRVKALANSFDDAKYFAKTLDAVGVNRDAATGKLSVDTEKLATAMKERPEATSYVLGGGGLAGRTESKVAMAQLQKDRLFPTAAQMMGTTDSGVKAMYSANAQTAQFRYGNVGNLINMML